MSSLSRKQEDRTAKEHGGRRISGSGNGWAVKNDVRNDLISYEMKTTGHRSTSLKLDDIRKAEKNALLDGREAVMGIELANTSSDGRTVYVVGAIHYREMEKAWLESRRW